PVGLWVDSSKDLDWILHQKAQGAEPYVVHITKSMQGFIGSHLNRERTKGGLGFQAHLWGKQNLQYANFAQQQGLPYVHVQYEDFVTQPETVLKRIAAFLDEKHRPQAPYWERDMHFVKGNPAAAVAFQPSLAEKQVGLNADLYSDGGRGLFLDEKWKKLLTGDQVKALYSLPMVKKASEKFGYTLPSEAEKAGNTFLLTLQYRLQTSQHAAYSTPRHAY
ncbi:MAG TPA: hypothetical protein DCE41_06305, partial [Cytophagales bacterium]|nr:hypothetical protein [Cytophagales bacterium]